MAYPDIRQVVVAGRTTAGTQDVTIAGFGTPKAAIIITVQATYGLSGYTYDHGYLSIGLTDGVTSYAAGVAVEAGVATSNTARAQHSGKLAAIPTSAGTALAVDVGFSTWITDGIRLNWGTVPAWNTIVTVILIGGTGVVNAKVGAVALGTGTAAINTTLGFTPSMVFTAGTAQAANVTATVANLVCGAWSPGASQQGCMAWRDADALATMTSSARFVTGFAFAGINANSLVYDVALGTYANGFSATPGASASSNVMPYLALEFGAGTGTSVVTGVLPTATGSYSQTGLTFQPGFLLNLAAHSAAAANAMEVGSTNFFGSFNVTAIDRTENLSCSSIGSADGEANAITSSMWGSEQNEIDGGGARDATSTFTSFNSDGWTKNLTYKYDTAAYRQLYIAIQTAPNIVDLPVNSLTQAQTLSSPSLTQHSKLTPNSLSQAQTLSQPSLLQHSVLNPLALAQLQTLSQPTLTQHGILTPSGLMQAQVLDSPVLLQHALLAPDDLSQTQDIDETGLTQAGKLSVFSLTHIETLSLPALTQHALLSPVDLLQGQTLNELLVAQGPLRPSDLLHVQTLAEPALVQHHLLGVDTLVHTQDMDSPVFVLRYTVTPAPLNQLQKMPAPTVFRIVSGMLMGDFRIYAEFGATLWFDP